MITVMRIFAGAFDILMIFAACDYIVIKQKYRNLVYWYCIIGAILNFVFICSMWP